MPAYRFNRTTGLIRFNRRIVGSVRRNGPEHAPWVGRIGPHVVEAGMADTAFREVAARAMGFPSAFALRQHASGIRASNRQRRNAWAASASHSVARARQELTPEIIERLQHGAIEIGETPLTVEQITTMWARTV